MVGSGADAVDYKLISICHKRDIVVSQDYGVAAMTLGKGAYAIHQSGKWYTNLCSRIFRRIDTTFRQRWQTGYFPNCKWIMEVKSDD